MGKLSKEFALRNMNDEKMVVSSLYLRLYANG